MQNLMPNGQEPDNEDTMIIRLICSDMKFIERLYLYGGNDYYIEFNTKMIHQLRFLISNITEVAILVSEMK